MLDFNDITAVDGVNACATFSSIPHRSIGVIWVGAS
jgi:hypothetical protein